MVRCAMIKPTELYACLFVRELPEQTLLRQQSKLQIRPFAVMEGQPPSQTVCALNTKARLMGATHGLTRIELETFPGMAAPTRSRQAERAMRDSLLGTVGAFSPRVED